MGEPTKEEVLETLESLRLAFIINYNGQDVAKHEFDIIRKYIEEQNDR